VISQLLDCLDRWLIARGYRAHVSRCGRCRIVATSGAKPELLCPDGRAFHWMGGSR